MNIRKRIITSLLILLMLPFTMFFIGCMCLMAYQENYNEIEYGKNFGTFETLANPIKILDGFTKNLYTELYECSKSEPDRLMDIDYLTESMNKVKKEYVFLAVRLEDEFVYIGNEEMYGKITQEFPEYGRKEELNNLLYMGGEFPCLLKQLDFVTSNSDKGTVFIVTNINELLPHIKFMGVQLLFQFALVVVCTACVLIFWLYRSMLKPLNGLSNATKRITAGDLDFTITDETDDEIGTLCKDFEEMRKRLKEHIERQQLYEKESRELISNISHDLKTPLTAIKGYSEGLLDGVADTEEKRERYIKTIYTKASTMAMLVDELSLYSKIDTDLIAYNFKKVRVKDYFEDCVEEIRIDLEIKGISMKFFNFVEADTTVIIDSEQLKRVINNIINNSVKYMDKENGMVIVRLTETEEEVQISLEDNGKGMSKEEVEHIFERFYRADSSRNSSQGGSGLGLAIAKKIVNIHGGNIWAQSQPQEGTQIVFTLKKIIEKVGDNNGENFDN